MEFVWKDDQYSDDGCSYKYQKMIQKKMNIQKQNKMRKM